MTTATGPSLDYSYLPESGVITVPILGWKLTDEAERRLQLIPELEKRIEALEARLEKWEKPIPGNYAVPAPAPAWNSYETYVEKVCAEEFQEEEGEESGLAELFSKAD